MRSEINPSNRNGSNIGSSKEFFPERPKEVENKHRSEYWEDGVRYYKMLEIEKVFDADTYDKMFMREGAIGKVKPQHKQKRSDVDPRTGRASRSKNKKPTIN